MIYIPWGKTNIDVWNTNGFPRKIIYKWWDVPLLQLDHPEKITISVTDGAKPFIPYLRALRV